MSFFVGIDIGGTFTDCVAVHNDGKVHYAKVPTTRPNFSEGFIEGLRQLAEKSSFQVQDFFGDIDRVSHGTTIGTNIIVEKKGAKTAFLTTKGHKDSISIMRGAGRINGIPQELLFHVQATDKPEPLVAYELVKEIDERIDCSGKIVVKINEEQVKEIIQDLVTNHQVDAIAINYLWSFLDPSHEQLTAKLINEIAPNVFVSISSEVSPHLGEYERSISTILNAYVGPDSTSYLALAEKELARLGCKKPIYIMQCNGGVAHSSDIRKAPIRTIGSGPVGGVVACLDIGQKLGYKNIIATDMGGTSFDVALIHNGEPIIKDSYVVDRFKTNLTNVEVESIACGGGSIARIDRFSNSIRVGPDSAGSVPGPICYGRGGQQPTVTDADVVLGFVSADSFLEGKMKLNEAAAREKIAELGQQLGLDPYETAAGILKINNMKAAALIRQQTIARGYDPRDFVIFSFGGAGPVHASEYAKELGISTVVIPLGNGASLLSAYGIASSDLMQIFDQEVSMFSPFSVEQVNSVFAELEQKAIENARNEGINPKDKVLSRSAMVRYRDQLFHKVSMPLNNGKITEQDLKQLMSDFEETYSSLYGEGAGNTSQGIEIFTLRCVSRQLFEMPEIQDQVTDSTNIEPRTTRSVFWTDRGFESTAIYNGIELKSNIKIQGPAIIEYPFTSVTVDKGQNIYLDKNQNLILEISK